MPNPHDLNDDLSEGNPCYNCNPTPEECEQCQKDVAEYNDDMFALLGEINRNNQSRPLNPAQRSVDHIGKIELRKSQIINS